MRYLAVSFFLTLLCSIVLYIALDLDSLHFTIKFMFTFFLKLSQAFIMFVVIVSMVCLAEGNPLGGMNTESLITLLSLTFYNLSFILFRCQHRMMEMAGKHR